MTIFPVLVGVYLAIGACFALVAAFGLRHSESARSDFESVVEHFEGDDDRARRAVFFQLVVFWPTVLRHVIAQHRSAREHGDES